MIGLNTCIVFSLNQLAAGKVLVSISIFLSWHRVIACIMMFAGGGSSLSLFASQWLVAILILPVDLLSAELSSFMGFSSSVSISIRILAGLDVDPILQSGLMDVCWGEVCGL